MTRKKVLDYRLRMIDALVVCTAEDVGILELRINGSVWRAKRWLDSRGLKMAPEKTEAFLVTDRRFFQYPKIALGEHEFVWKRVIRTSLGETVRAPTSTPTDHPEMSRRTPTDGFPQGWLSTCVRAQRQVPLADPHSDISV